QDIDAVDRLLGQDQADRRLALELEKVREDRSAFIENKFDLAWAEREYPKIFERAGLTVPAGQEATQASRIKRSPVKEQLVAALDDWASVAWARGQKDLHQRLLHVARQAAPDPWNDQIRNVANWSKPEAFKELTAKILAHPQALARLSPKMLHLIGT